MYESFFGLRERPFDLVPNPRFLYLPPGQREALSNLRYGLTAARGLTLLVGEAGTGKTTLMHAILAELDEAHVEYVLLSNPTLTRAEFYEFLAASFELSAQAGRSKTRFLFELRRHLLERHAAQTTLTALIVDEAQSLSDELLEEIRLLSNMELADVKLLSIVLAGQPELAARLNEVGLRQLKQRIGLRCEIAAFTLPETGAYIAGRLRIAGGDPATIFSREAVHAIHDASGGLPRTINVVCENALIGGFAAGHKPVTKAMVQEVCRDFDLTGPQAAFTTMRAPSTGSGSASVAAPKPIIASAPAVDPDPAVSPEAIATPAASELAGPIAAPDAASAAIVTSPATGEPELADAIAGGEAAPMFGNAGRKRRFSFF